MLHRSEPSSRSYSIRLLTLALTACGMTASTVFAQSLPTQFTSVSYNVTGKLNASGGGLEAPWGGVDSKVALGFTSTPLTLEHEWDVDASSATQGNVSALASTFAQAEIGSLHVGLNATLTAHQNAANGNPNDLRYVVAQMSSGRTQARWQDTAVADAAGGNHTIIFTASLVLDGSMNINFLAPQIPANTSYVFGAGSDANVSLRLTSPSAIIAPYPGGIFGQVFGSTVPGVTPVNHLPPSSIPVTLVMQDGVPFTLDYTLELLAISSAVLGTTSTTALDTAAFIDADFTHTLRWGGILSATDSITGLPVTDYSLISASGFDYRYAAPTPEPATALLLVTSAATTMHRRRRQ
jgi:hypothetical protein